MLEKVEEIVARQTEAIQNLKIDKITVWDWRIQKSHSVTRKSVPR